MSFSLTAPGISTCNNINCPFLVAPLLSSFDLFSSSIQPSYMNVVEQTKCNGINVVNIMLTIDHSVITLFNCENIYFVNT